MRREVVAGVLGSLLALFCFTVSPQAGTHLVAVIPSSSALSFRQPTSDGLTRLCANTTWRPGLWLQCHFNHIVGGLNNARNRLQSCLRLAIDAGAGVILPPIIPRNKEFLAKRYGNESAICIDYFWDVSELVKRVGRTCPQLLVQKCTEPAEKWPAWISRRILAPFREWNTERYSRGGLPEAHRAPPCQQWHGDFQQERACGHHFLRHLPELGLSEQQRLASAAHGLVRAPAVQSRPARRRQSDACGREASRRLHRRAFQVFCVVASVIP